MVKDLKSIIARNQATLAEDAVGICALMVILLVGLYLPLLV
ncbi:hypothetical protein [Roseicitreum antarcticum]|uniref:Uncharacterized protein n=1 Tax=Roseicitreum antarcticum TaxID=564137 RepID=A0A1H3C9Z6_9RHOB|nr:hypothetical protein [Roseicitreum antarcticum]SDX50860.1 hypothetical protein SAMN04488238_10980 [Roseicitreum antarcticum]